MITTFESSFLKGIDGLGISLSSNQIDQFNIYFKELKKWSKKINLIAKLTTDEQAIMTSFQKNRMLLDRIWIITNQSRIQMGMDGYKRGNLKKILDNLVDMGYLKYEAVHYESKFNDVYILTELGKEQVF